jgi:hypothetical protein
MLEVVYTVPLPHQAVLLGFASELNGARQAGTIVARREAERQYEAALVAGDAPVMLEALEGGLHTANIGNLEPGDEIVLEVRFAQLLAFEQGRLRLAAPETASGWVPQQERVRAQRRHRRAFEVALIARDDELRSAGHGGCGLQRVFGVAQRQVERRQRVGPTGLRHVGPNEHAADEIAA